MKDVLKPPQRRETKRHRKKSWVRPETFQIATLAIRLVNAVARFIDLLPW